MTHTCLCRRSHTRMDHPVEQPFISEMRYHEGDKVVNAGKEHINIQRGENIFVEFGHVL